MTVCRQLSGRGYIGLLRSLASKFDLIISKERLHGL